MKPYHVATLALSCVTIGVLLTLLIQHKLRERGKPHNAATVLNPVTCSEGSAPLQPALTTETKTVKVPATTDASAPAGSGERWTPLK